MKKDQAKQTPLVELLGAVPMDVRIGVVDGEGWQAGTTWHAIGRLCHEAASELRRLDAENKRLENICYDYLGELTAMRAVNHMRKGP